MSDDITIIGPKIYSSLPKAAERKEIPVQCEASWEIKWVPITAPPPNCREVSLSPQLFEEYNQALKSYLDDAKLKHKFERNLPLSPAEKQVMEKIKTAENTIYQYGVTLFSAALLSGKPSQNSLDLWQDFAARAEQMPINLTRTNTLFLLADPKLSSGDRKLLLDYCTSASGEIKPELGKRFAEHFQAIGANYNGWQGGNYYTASHVFINVLAEILGPYGFERFETELFNRDPKKYLVGLTDKSIAEYSSFNKPQLLLEQIKYYNEFVRLEPGLMKTLYHQQARDLYVLALARGYSLVKYEQVDLSLVYPGLPAREYADMQVINFYHQHTAGKTYRFHQQMFEATLVRFVEAYLHAPLRQKGAYSGLLQRFDWFAYKFGFSSGELDQIVAAVCRRTNYRLSPRGRLSKLADLAKLKNVEVAPEGLPAEIKNILVQTGHWRLVSDNLRNIAFTPKIKMGSGSASTVVGGLAVSLLKRIDVAYQDTDGSQVSALEIAMTLVHEAAHLSWRNKDLLLRQTTPNERNAYAVEYHFLEQSAKVFGRSNILDERLVLVKKVITVANRVLGYGVDDLSVNKTDLPSREFCRKHGVAGPEELNLSFDPASTL